MLLSLLLYIVCSQAFAQEFKILNHESFDAALTPSMRANGGNSAANRATPEASFNAYGRRFDLNLGSNARVLRGLSRAQQARLDDVELLAGELAGIPGSWVRLTRYGDAISGAIWDGNELYGIETRRNVQGFLVNPDSGEDIIIYRLSDTIGGGTDILIEAHVSAGLSYGSSKSAATSAALNKIMQPAVTPAVELELGMIADEDFVNVSADPTDERLIAIANIMDGIFFWQVGVRIIISEMDIFESGAGPLTATDPEALLSQLEDYKFSSPSLNGLDLAHLFTGRELTDSMGGPSDIVGIANLAAVCSARFGVALTQANFNGLNDALVATHEVAHNLGAPHDGEEGSPCESAPEMLMSATFNGSEEFSQCSIDEMLPVIDAASCISLIPQDDVQLSVIGVPEYTERNEEFTPSFVVDSTGPNSAYAVSVSISTTGLSVEQIYDNGVWDCEDTGTSVDCNLDTIPGGQSESFDIRFRDNSSESAQIDATLYAANDSNLSNNSASLFVNAYPETYLYVELSPDQKIVKTGETTSLFATISNVGQESAPGVTADGTMPEGIELLAATPDSGSCSVQLNSIYEFDCTLGELTPSQSMMIEFEVRGDFMAPAGEPDSVAATSGTVSIWTRSEIDGYQIAVHNDNLSVTIAERATDLQTTLTSPTQMDKDETAQVTVDVENLGPDATRNTKLILDYETKFSLQISGISSNVGSCTHSIADERITCVVNELQAGQTLSLLMNVTALKQDIARLVADNWSREAELFNGNNAESEEIVIDDSSPPQLRTVLSRSSHHLLAMGDINGNGHTDLAILARDVDADRHKVFVLDGGSGALLAEVPFGTAEPWGYAMVDDLTGDQLPEPAVQNLHEARAKDHMDDALLGKVPFDPNYEDEIAFLSVGDADGNSIPDLAMVARDGQTGWVRAQVKNVTTGQLVSRIPFDANYLPLAAVVLDNIADSPANEIAVFGERDDGVYRAQIKDSRTGNIISRVYFDKRYDMLRFVALPDATGSLTYLGVVGRYNGVLRTQIKRALDGQLVSLVRFDGNYFPRYVIGFPDSNGSGGGEIAMVGSRTSNGDFMVQVKEIEDGTPLGVMPLSWRYEPKDAIIVNGVDGTGRSEIVVLGTQPGDTIINLQVRDLLTGDQVKNILIP